MLTGKHKSQEDAHAADQKRQVKRHAKIQGASAPADVSGHITEMNARREFRMSRKAHRS